MPWLTANAELQKGISIEKEHLGTIQWLIETLGGDPKDVKLQEEVARRIAQDHLDELPDYYSRLEKMEKGGS